MIQLVVILRSAFVTVEEKTLVVQQGMERVVDIHWLWAVIIDCNYKEVPINPIIESRTHYYSSRNPEYVIIWLCLLVLSNNIKFRKKIFMQPDVIINEDVNQVEVISSSENSASLHRPGLYGCCWIIVWFRSDSEAPNFMTDYRIITRSFTGKTRWAFQLKLNRF
jgi:hypothetical protein